MSWGIVKILVGAVAALVLVYAIHWIIELIAFSMIGVVLFSGYKHMRDKLRDEKKRTAALQSELNKALLDLELEINGLLQDDGKRKSSPERMH